MNSVFLILIIVIVGDCVSSQKNEIIYNLARIGMQSNSDSGRINKQCSDELKTVKNSIDQRHIWAIKLLDASGRFGSGFVIGNNYLLGSKPLCDLVNSPIKLTQSPQYHHNNIPGLMIEPSPFPVEYRIVHIRHTSKWQFDANLDARDILHLGLCFPQSCDDQDTMLLINKLLLSKSYFGFEFLERNVTAIGTKLLKLRDDFFKNTSFKILTTLVTIILINGIIGTIYTYSKHRGITVDRQSPDLFLDKYFQCFSISDNFKQIFDSKTCTDSIKAINGIRTIAMLWLISGHIVFFSLPMTDNAEGVLTYSEFWYYQPISTDFLGVDTFLALSAFLVGLFNFKKITTTKGGIAYSFRCTILRYIRLTPLYVIVILVTYNLTKYLADTTPFLPVDVNEKACQEYWWMNILYINNLYPLSLMCINWSWYLSNDYQCFVLALIVLVLYSRNKAMGMIFGVSVSIVAIFYCMHNAYKSKFSFAMDSYYNTAEVMYLPTWNRIPAYFTSVIAGSYFAQNNRKLNMSKRSILLHWILSLTIMYGTILMHFVKNHIPLLSILYSGFGRILWSYATCWIIMACASDNGGVVTKIMESNLFVPLSRISYATYLTHPVWIMFIIMNGDTPFHLNVYLYAITTIGFLLTSFAVALFFCLFFEYPFLRLLRTFVVK